MKRIDPDAVPGLFRSHNVTPIRGMWFSEEDDGECFACLVGIHALESTALSKVSGIVAEDPGAVNYEVIFSTIDGLGTAYLCGLSDGWDTRPSFQGFQRDRGYRAGFSDGAAAKMACIRERLMEELPP
jgi:hypothetical protein